MTHPTRRAGLLGLTLMLAVAACGGGDAEEKGWITGLLDRIPDTPASAEYITVVDLTAAAAAAGITTPDAGASEEDLGDYFRSLPHDALVPDLLRDAFPRFGDLTGELGVDPALVGAAIMAGNAPETFQVLAGGFDPAVIDQAVHAEPAWSDLLTTGEYGGVAYYRWGDDFTIDTSRVTPVRPLGRGGRLALDAGFLYWVPWTAGMEGLIDARAGAVPTLADDSRLARAARALAAAGVYSAILTDRPLVEDAAASGLVLGIGGGRDEAGAYWVIVAVHDTAAAAQESATAVRSVLSEGTILSTGQRWSERVTGFDIEVEDDMLVGVVRSAGREGDWLQAYYGREMLLVAAQG